MNKPQRKQRNAGAAVEAALCLPLILLIISATIELTTLIYLKESLTIAAYEGARLAVTRHATDESVRERVARVLTERHIDMTGYPLSEAVVITPPTRDALLMEPVEVSVTGPTLGNTVSPIGLMRFISPPDMTAAVVMRKEFTSAE